MHLFLVIVFNCGESCDTIVLQGTGGIKDLMESFSNTEYVPCAVELIDARNSSLTPGFEIGTHFGEKKPLNRYADLPCSGMYPQVDTQVRGSCQGW